MAEPDYEKPGFLAQTARAFLDRQPPPTDEERAIFYANMRRTEADAHEAANVVRPRRTINVTEGEQA